MIQTLVLLLVIAFIFTHYFTHVGIRHPEISLVFLLISMITVVALRM